MLTISDTGVYTSIQAGMDRFYLFEKRSFWFKNDTVVFKTTVFLKRSLKKFDAFLLTKEGSFFMFVNDDPLLTIVNEDKIKTNKNFFCPNILEKKIIINCHKTRILS